MGQRCCGIQSPADSDNSVKLRRTRYSIRFTYVPKGVQYICPQVEDYYRTWTPNHKVLENRTEEIIV